MSDRVLSCPPASCMLFNCPGHEFFQKGLSGCGIDTLNAPVDTEFSLKFTVADFSNPPATVSVERRIIVVSPCQHADIYCPELAWPAHATGAHACGSTNCPSRAAILALEASDATQTSPSVKFSTSVPVSALYSVHVGTSPTGNTNVQGGTDLSEACYLVLRPSTVLCPARMLYLDVSHC